MNSENIVAIRFKIKPNSSKIICFTKKMFVLDPV